MPSLQVATKFRRIVRMYANRKPKEQQCLPQQSVINCDFGGYQILFAIIKRYKYFLSNINKLNIVLSQIFSHLSLFVVDLL
jgi:hypothetical protein